MRFLKKPMAMLSVGYEKCEHSHWTCNSCGSMITLKSLTKKEREKAIKQAEEIVEEGKRLRAVAEIILKEEK